MIYKDKDSDGRTPLTGREYSALLSLFASGSALGNTTAIHQRLRELVPNGWRDFRMIENRMEDLAARILSTVPYKKLAIIQAELPNIKVKTFFSIPGGTRLDKGVVCVDEDNFIAVLDRVISMDCWCCTKKGTKVRKCPILQMIQSVLPYDPDPGFDNDACPIAGKTSLLAEEIK